MSKKIYVGNLPFTSTSETLAEIFSPFGEIASSKIVTDRDTGRSKGFGFIEMIHNDQADSAIAKLHGSDFGGRSLTVNEARPSNQKDPQRMTAARGARADQPRGHAPQERSFRNW
jgi:RNA recognition motif-containing protein